MSWRVGPWALIYVAEYIITSWGLLTTCCNTVTVGWSLKAIKNPCRCGGLHQCSAQDTRQWTCLKLKLSNTNANFQKELRSLDDGLPSQKTRSISPRGNIKKCCSIKNDGIICSCFFSDSKILCPVCKDNYKECKLLYVSLYID